MAGRYDRVNGSWEKVRKRYDKVNGLWVPVKKRFDKVNGTWVQSYTGAVEWTYTVTAWANHAFGIDSYGNNEVDSSEIEGGGTSDTVDGTGNCTVVYTFKDPLFLKAGQTIEIFSDIADRAETDTYINGTFIYRFGIHNEIETYIYTLPNDLTISTITAYTVASNSINHTSTALLRITIHSDISTFTLNNSGTSENQ